MLSEEIKTCTFLLLGSDYNYMKKQRHFLRCKHSDNFYCCFDWGKCKFDKTEKSSKDQGGV